MKLETGIQITPSKDLIHGVEGVGKSTMANTYPNAIFLDCEGSTTKLDVARLRTKTWADFKQAVNLILTDKDFAGFRTVIVDTVDWLEKLVIKEVVRQDQASSITDHKLYGFGKGDTRVKAFFDDEIIPLLELLMTNNKNIVLVAHSVVKTFNDPIGGAYDYWAMDMGKKPASTIRQWANNVFFMNYKTYITQGKGIDKSKAKGGKDVYIYTQRTPQYEAKRRDILADEIKVTEGVCPYPQIIGTTAVANEIEELLNTALIEVSEITDKATLTAHWKANGKLHKINPYKDLIVKKGAEFKAQEAETQTPPAADEQ